MGKANNKQSSETKYYYVDESGDHTIFGSKHRIMLGKPGVSDYFMLGLISVKDPYSLSQDMENLRQTLCRDPYFNGIPSMKPSEGKTAVMFHAKDDIPEVRKEVFALLSARNDIRFFAAIKDKYSVLDYVLSRNQTNDTYHYSPNELYDFLVRRLFRDLLHKNEKYVIVFSERLNSNRTKALGDQLRVARENYYKKYHSEFDTEVIVKSIKSYQDPCLQAVDYYLWALWRFYVNREERYLNYLSSSVRLIMDIDDIRSKPTGAYYSPGKPINLNALPPLKNKPEI